MLPNTVLAPHAVGLQRLFRSGGTDGDGSLKFTAKLLYFGREPLPPFPGRVKGRAVAVWPPGRGLPGLGWKEPGPPIPVQQLKSSMEMIRKRRLITGGQRVITWQCFPLRRTTPAPAGLAGGSLPCGAPRIWPLGAKSRCVTPNWEFTKPIRF